MCADGMLAHGRCGRKSVVLVGNTPLNYLQARTNEQSNILIKTDTLET